ncbi:RNA polymerase subunit sigma-70, partial [Mycobacterium sp. ITM-2017-0098]
MSRLRIVTVLAVGNAHVQGSDEDAFLADAQKYRRELLAHCY